MPLQVAVPPVDGWRNESVWGSWVSAVVSVGVPVDHHRGSSQLASSRYAPWLVAVLAALPSAVWARRAGWIADDWYFTSVTRYGGLVSGDLPWRTRPLHAAWISLSYGVLGEHPVLHALAMAALNALAAVLLLSVLRRHMPPDIAVVATSLWAAIPNRDASRFWPSTAPMLIGLCLALLAVLALGRRPLAVTGALLAASVLAYEASFPLGAGFVVAWLVIHGEAGRRAVDWSIAVVPLVAASGWVWLSSPKREGAAPLATAERFLDSQLGAATLGAASAPVVIATCVGLVLVGRRLLRDRRARDADRAVVVGVALLLLGGAPFLLSGFDTGSSGLFDRGNTVAAIGTAVVLTGLLAMIPNRRVVVVGGAVAVVAMTSMCLRDVRTWWLAVDEGRAMITELDEALPTGVAVVQVVPELPNRGGLSAFVGYNDVGDALGMRRGVPDLLATIEPDHIAPPAAGTRYAVFDWRTGALTIHVANGR
jgi:hypothetical protein